MFTKFSWFHAVRIFSNPPGQFAAWLAVYSQKSAKIHGALFAQDGHAVGPYGGGVEANMEKDGFPGVEV
eukprot:4175588-Pyramimonas_sp.AAC.1